MAKTNKYKNVEDVVLALASDETTIEKLGKIKWRASSKGNEEYVKLIEDGITSYRKLVKIEKAKKIGWLPEEILQKWEIEEEVGWRGLDNY